MMKRFTGRNRCALGALVVAAAVAAPASGQEATYRSRSSVSFGALDQIMSLAQRFGADTSTETVETRYIKGNRMRTDTDQSSTIMDMDARRMIVLNHDQMTYMEISLEDVMSMAGSVAAGADGARPSQDAPETPEAEVTWSVSVDPTGESERILGYEASRYLVVIEAEYRSVPESDQPDTGTRMAAVTDIWVSDEAPSFELDAEAVAGAAGMARNAGGAGSSMGALFAQNPDGQEAFERAAEEMAKIEGTSLRSKTHLVIVPLDQELDRDLALAEEDEEEEESGGSALDALRGLAGGAFGGGRNQPPPDEPAPTQSTLLTLIEEVFEIDDGPIPDTIFEVPEGYTPVAMPGVGG